MAVINAMNEAEHPTQAVGDLAALQEHFGDLRGLRVLYVGAGNSTAAALALALARVPAAVLTVLTPRGYGLPAALLANVKRTARANGARVVTTDDPRKLPTQVDAVYGTRWRTTGTTKTDPDWLTSFRPFRVSGSMMSRVSKAQDTVFMHDLPAVRGEDVDAAVLDGEQSIAFRQAEYKLYGAMAILEACLCGSFGSR